MGSAIERLNNPGLDDNKSKRHLKSGFAQFQTSSILFNFI